MTLLEAEVIAAACAYRRELKKPRHELTPVSWHVMRQFNLAVEAYEAATAGHETTEGGE